MTEQLVGYTVGDEVDGVPVTLSRHRQDDDAGIAAMAALLRAAGPHVARLLDVGTAGNGDTVLVLADDPVRLTDLVTAPGGLARAEAVTVLVPLVRALDRAHRAGVAHGALTVSAVRLSADGTPVLHDWRAAVLAERHGPLAFASAAQRDDEALASLAGRLLGPEVTERLAGLDAEAAVDLLFTIAEPEPVRLFREDGPAETGTPGRLWTGEAAGTPPRPRLRTQLRAVRLRVWTAAGTAVALLITALVLLPGRGADAAGVLTTTPHATAPARPSPSGAVVAPRSLAAAPAAALLLKARAVCRSTHCLEQVDQAGSPAWEADVLTLRTTRLSSPSAAGLRTVSELGAAAVLESTTLTVLVVRGPAGWSLRDVVPRKAMVAE